MKNKEALDIVLELAKLGAENEHGNVDETRVDSNYEAIYQIEDYYNDVMED